MLGLMAEGIHSCYAAYAAAYHGDQEINYLQETLPENGVWNISWTWFDNMESYGKEFIISENWWKSITAIEKLCFLKNFNAVKL